MVAVQFLMAYGLDRLRIYVNDRISIEQSGCWTWKQARDRDGYGRATLTVAGETRSFLAHRISFFALNCRLNDVLDHLCRNPSCVNPHHLEEVSQGENNRRSRSPSALNAKKATCAYGHLLSGPNLHVRKSGVRVCLTCRRRLAREQHARRKARATT